MGVESSPPRARPFWETNPSSKSANKGAVHFWPTPSFWTSLVVEAQCSSSSRALATENREGGTFGSTAQSSING